MNHEYRKRKSLSNTKTVSGNSICFPMKMKMGHLRNSFQRNKTRALVWIARTTWQIGHVLFVNKPKIQLYWYGLIIFSILHRRNSIQYIQVNAEVFCLFVWFDLCCFAIFCSKFLKIAGETWNLALSVTWSGFCIV